MSKTNPQCEECLKEATTHETYGDAWYCDDHACDHYDNDGHCCLQCGADLGEYLAVRAYDIIKAGKE